VAKRKKIVRHPDTGADVEIDDEEEPTFAPGSPEAARATAPPPPVEGIKTPGRPDPSQPDETVPGGRYIRGARVAADGKHYGGQVVNSEGEVLESFDDKAENTG
jgi:hypothetical protein